MKIQSTSRYFAPKVFGLTIVLVVRFWLAVANADADTVYTLTVVVKSGDTIGGKTLNLLWRTSLPQQFGHRSVSWFVLRRNRDLYAELAFGGHGRYDRRQNAERRHRQPGT